MIQSNYINNTNPKIDTSNVKINHIYHITDSNDYYYELEVTDTFVYITYYQKETNGNFKKERTHSFPISLGYTIANSIIKEVNGYNGLINVRDFIDNDIWTTGQAPRDYTNYTTIKG